MTATPIAHVNTPAGQYAGRITAERDEYHDITPADLTPSHITTRIVWTPRGTYDGYYETGPGTDWITDAYERIQESTYTTEEAAEVLQRWARIFHPDTPIICQTIRTGYSQGDQVTLLGYVPDPTQDTIPGETAYQQAARHHEQIAQTIDLAGAIARGQVWRITYETAALTDITVKDDQLTATVTYTEEESSSGYLTLKEFDPWTELIDYAADLLPMNHTITPIPDATEY